MSISDSPVTTYQIQYLNEFNLWEDIPHKTIYDIGTLENIYLKVKGSKSFGDDMRILKVTKEVFNLERVE